MAFSLYLWTLVPLILFAVIDSKFSQKWALISGTFVALAIVVAFYLKFGSLDSVELASVGLLVVLGIISLRTKNPLYFKFQPAIAGVCFGLGILVYRYGFPEAFHDYFRKFVPFIQENSEFSLEEIEGMLATMSDRMWVVALALLAHAALIAYSAMRMGNAAWLTAKALQLPLVVFFLIVVENASRFL